MLKTIKDNDLFINKIDNNYNIYKDKEKIINILFNDFLSPEKIDIIVNENNNINNDLTFYKSLNVINPINNNISYIVNKDNYLIRKEYQTIEENVIFNDKFNNIKNNIVFKNVNQFKIKESKDKSKYLFLIKFNNDKEEIIFQFNKIKNNLEVL